LMSAAAAEIARLEPLKQGKHDAAEFSKGLEDAIETKTSAIALKNTTLTETKANNAQRRADDEATHVAVLELLQAEIRFLDGNVTKLQEVHDKFTAQHSSTLCAEKEEKGETICKRCSAGENMSACHDECISSNVTCHKDPGCACDEAAASTAATALAEAASKKGKGQQDPVTDSAAHHSAKVADADLHGKMQEAKQTFGLAIDSANEALKGLGVNLELNKRSTQTVKINKEAAIADFDKTLADLATAKQGYELELIKEEDNKKKAEDERKIVVEETEEGILKMKDLLHTEIGRLQGEASAQRTAKGKLIVDHNTEMKSLEDAHKIAEALIATDILNLNTEKTALQAQLDAKAAEHGVPGAL